MSEELREVAYSDSPLLIGEDQTISQPYIVYCWFDHTSAVRPLETARMRGMPETYPFGL